MGGDASAERDGSRPPSMANAPRATSYVQCPKCLQTLLAQTGVVNMCPCGQRFMAPNNGHGAQNSTHSPPPAPLRHMGPLTPEERRAVLLADQDRFEGEVRATRQRRQAERIVQVQCPGCTQTLSAKTGELLQSMGMMRCGDCSTTFQVQLPGHLQDSLALPPGQRVGRETSVRTVCPQCTTHLMAMPGTVNMCVECGQQFMMQAEARQRAAPPPRSERIPLSAIPAAEARPHNPPAVDFGALKGWGWLHAAHEFKLRCKNEHAAVRWVRAASSENKVQWVEVSQLSLVDHPIPAPEPVVWVPRSGIDGRPWQVRSDDLSLVERFRGLKMVHVAALPLADKNIWFRHFLEQFTIPAEAEVGPIRLEIRRTGMLENTRDCFLALLPEEFCRTFRYRMCNETDFYQDVGGVTREVFMLFTEAFFSSAVGLFALTNAEEVMYTIDPCSGTSEETLEFYRFAGRVLGKAFLDGHNIAARLSPCLLKQLLRVPVTSEDLQAVDPELYKSLEWMKRNSITDVLFEHFVVELNSTEVVELVNGGRHKPVTDENKMEYIELKSQWILQAGFKLQLEQFCQGFWEVIPQCDKVLTIFTMEELDMMISGLYELDVHEWRQHSQYTGDYHDGSPVVQWFWMAVESLSAEERGKLLQFATGSSRIPVEGFKGMQSAKGKSCMFTLAIDPNSTVSIPRAHTCFNRIDIPEYRDPDLLEQHLRMVIETEMLGFMMEE